MQAVRVMKSSKHEVENLGWLALHRVVVCAVVCVVCVLSPVAGFGVARAASVGFTVEDLPTAGPLDVWRVTYYLDGLSLESGQGLEVRFSPTEYGALSAPLAPAGGEWDAIGVQPDPLLPDAGSYDLRAQTVSPATDGPFQVDFVWKGTGQPSAQTFVVYDESFQPLETGETYPIPEPAAALGGLAALSALVFLKRRRSHAQGRAGLFAILLIAVGLAHAAPADAAIVHSFDAGDYTIEYWQVERSRVARTVTDFGFEARIVSETGASVPRVIARAISGSAASIIAEDVLVFGDVGALQSVESLDTFTLRQDRAVPFDPADLSFAVELDSPHPCAAIELAHTSAAPLEPVTLLGLSVADETTRVFAEGSVSNQLLPVAQAEDDSLFVFAPVHADLGGDAGSVRIQLETAGETCDLGPLLVSALPAASATEADEVLALVEELAARLLVSHAFDPDVFDPMATNNSAIDLSLAMLHRALLYESSPTKVATIRADVAALSVDERILIGRILVETGAREALQELLVLYEDFELTSHPQALLGGTGRLVGQLAEVASPAASTGACVPASFERASILTAGELSAAMTTARSAASSLDREATRRKVASTVIGTAGFAGPAGQAVAVAGGAILLVQESGDENSAKLLPSNITETVIEVTVNPINEDYMDVPGQSRPRWRAFTTATSEGLNLSKRVLDIALKSAGALPLPAAAGAPLAAFDTASTWAFQAQPDEATCFTIPPHTWSRISVSDEQWLARSPDLSGTSIRLINTIEIDPVDIGNTNIEVRLAPSLFPCDACSLDATSADVDVEVRQKEVVFTRVKFPIETSTAEVTLTGTIRNSSKPDEWNYQLGSGVVELDNSPPSPNFSITLKGLGDERDFPVTVSVQSDSLTLPTGAPPREGSAEVVLEAMVEVFRSAEGCVGPDTPVTLDAVVTGFANRDVSWTQPPGTTVNPVTGTQATFMASEPGTYTVTAASVEDPEVEGSIDVVVSECDIELFVWATTIASTPGSSDADPPCGPGSSPGGQDDRDEIGVEPLFMDTGTFRNEEDWTGGGDFSFHLDLEDSVHSTFHFDQSCYSATIPTAGSAIGSLSSVGGSNTLDVDFDVALEGGCRQITDDFRECASGASLVSTTATFTFEHQGEGTQSYELSMDLDCTLTESTVVAGVPNVQTSIAVLDEQGNWNDGAYAFEALDTASLFALTRVVAMACYAGQHLSIQETFNFQNIPEAGTPDPGAPGQKYTAAFIVSLTGAPVIEGDPANPPAEISDQGSIQGAISLQPVAAP